MLYPLLIDIDSLVGDGTVGGDGSLPYFGAFAISGSLLDRGTFIAPGSLTRFGAFSALGSLLMQWYFLGVWFTS